VQELEVARMARFERLAERGQPLVIAPVSVRGPDRMRAQTRTEPDTNGDAA
jgi:hypothetical protein